MAKSSMIGIKSWFERLKKNTTVLFWILLVILFALEGLVVNKSVQVVLNAGKLEGAINPSGGGVRFNFNEYQQVVKRIEDSKTYTPPATDLPDPFTVNAQSSKNTP